MSIGLLKIRMLKINNLLYMKDTLISLDMKQYDKDKVDITIEYRGKKLSNPNGFFGDLDSALEYLIGFEDAIKAISKNY